jgi:signal transduction histidine kinase/DNA-binding LacI/PurR family transcriptional regulator/DNA-binding response OmpR family regulator
MNRKSLPEEDSEVQHDDGKRRTTIGVLIGSQAYFGTILGNFIGPLLQGVRSAAQDYGCNLLLACGMEHYTVLARPAWPVPAPDVDFVPVGPWNTNGLIVVNPLLSATRSHYIEELSVAGMPIVHVASGAKGSSITVDNENGLHQALAHLVEHGHRSIAFIAGSERDLLGDSGARLRAYQAAVQEYGLVASPSLIAYGEHGIEGGAHAMQQILSSRVPFTAVMASNDESAIGAMQVLRNIGLKTPQDIAIIGFDDCIEALIQVPPLTTLRFSPAEMGYQALELLYEYILGRKKDIEIVKIPARLVIRQSCGCQPDGVPAFTPAISIQPGSYVDRTATMSQLVQAMTDNVVAETQHLNLEEVYALCSQLVETFASSLKHGKPLAFCQALDKILWHVEAIGDDAHMWYAAISTLESRLEPLLGVIHLATLRPQAADLLRQAWLAISESIRRQSRTYLVGRRWTTDCIGQLTAHLLTALDEAQIFEILAEHLPKMEIQHASVAFFEPEKDDPVAWSSLRVLAAQSQPNSRFPSRQFPPPGLYAEPFSLALLPLTSLTEKRGFAVFDATHLDIYATIIWQLVTSLKVVALYRTANEGRRLAEEANRLKSRFLSMVSHELCTPLSLIVEISENLLQKETGAVEECRQDLTTIQASAQHLDVLIRDVLDLARAEVDQLKLSCGLLDLTEVLRPAAELGEQLASDKGLTWKATLPAHLPKIWGDRTRLWQVIMNLINNAVKFTDRGQVSLHADASDQAITVTISDTGLGISPEEQALIFDEFRQCERTTARGYGGLGLGLAICKRLVELHGGQMGAHSSGEEGEGSIFYFSLPQLNQATHSAEDASPTLNQKVLLGVKKSDHGCALYEHLTQRGFEVQVLEVDQAHNWPLPLLTSPPKAVVLDRKIANEQGWETLQLLRQNPSTQDIPVTFYSLEQSQDKGAALELDYLPKPINPTELTQALERQGLSCQSADKTILIVDDEPYTLRTHADMVKAWSPTTHVLTAQGGQAAIEMIRQARPDLVLLDLMMPELDGFKVLEIMHNEAISRDIPVIILTAQVLTQEDMARLNTRVATVLQKELFSVAETLAYVEAALSRNKNLGVEAQRLARRAMAYIHEHYGETISLESIAHCIGVSKEYLARCFRQETGVTVITYLNRYRVAQAKPLLRNKETSVTDVALQVGFSSSAYFSRVFHQEIGKSPQKYQQTH